MTSLSIILNPCLLPSPRDTEIWEVQILKDSVRFSPRPWRRDDNTHAMKNQVPILVSPLILHDERNTFKKEKGKKKMWRILSLKKTKTITGQMMRPSWDRLSSVSLRWPCNKQRGADTIFTEKERCCFLVIKTHFAFHLHSQLKPHKHGNPLWNATYKCDQSLFSQLEAEVGIWCLSVSVGGIQISLDLTMEREIWLAFFFFFFRGEERWRDEEGRAVQTSSAYLFSSSLSFFSIYKKH